MMHSLKDEIAFLFSGRGMPYEKVAIMVAVVCAVVFTILLGNNTIHNAPVAIIDRDNSRYSREIIDEIDASPFIDVKDIIHTAVSPESLFYNDRYVAVIYLPQDLEKTRYGSQSGAIGVFYDNTSTAQSAEVMEALNEIVAAENAKLSGTEGSRVESGISLRDRLLFNPQGSAANNGEV